MIGGELGISNLEKIELLRFRRMYDYNLYDDCSEIHFTTIDGVRLILVFDDDIEQLFREALDNIKEM